MALYSFELGRKRELCFAELISLLGKDALHERNIDTAMFNIEDDTNITGLQNDLGGTIKIIKIIDQLPYHSSCAPLTPEIQKIIEKHLLSAFEGHTGKIPFAISLLSFKHQQELNIKQLLNFSKKVLKSLGLNCRFVNKDFGSPKPSTIYKAKVLQKGIDICLIKGAKDLFIGETVSLQDIDDYSLRDFGKPKRDPKVGMLPPKLAQVMINLAGKNTKTIFDPFCGTGTVLIEAMLMNKATVGSDIDQRMVEFSQENCKWAEETFGTKSPYRIFGKDAQKIDKSDLPEKIDAIVTEGYLGKPISRIPDERYQEFAFKELTALHKNWLSKLHSLTPKTCKVVMCVTAFKTPNSLIHLPNFEMLAKNAGYKVTETYTYDREEQVIARDIKVLEKI